MTRFLSLLLLILLPALAIAQSGEIDTLLQERDQLMKQYEYYSSQKSNFWGKQSKKDLMAIIESLKEIIRNDTRLVVAYKNEQLRKTASLTAENSQLNQQVKSDRNMISEQIFSLQDQIKTLETRMKAKDRKIGELQEELKDEKTSANHTQQYLYITGILLALTTTYSIMSWRKQRRRRR